MNKTNAVCSTLLLFASLLCAASSCLADGADVTVNGGWGLKPVSYQTALKKARFPILLPQGWRGEDCEFYLNWIKTEKEVIGNDPGPRLPSRQAIAVALKGSSNRLIVESPYLENLSAFKNRQGMYWIVAAGYFTNALNNPRQGGFSLGHHGETSYAILSSSADKAANDRFEQSLR